MAAITDYASLVSALSSWAERDLTADADEIIGLAEAEFRIYFGPNYAQETSVTLTFTAGVATIPTGFQRAISMVHSSGAVVEQASYTALQQYNPYGQSGIPALYAVLGASIYATPVFDGTCTFAYDAALVGLTSSNTTNWLVTNAPQAYLSMCLSMIKAKYEDYQGAALMRQQALTTLDALGIQDMVAKFSNSEMFIAGVTP